MTALLVGTALALAALAYVLWPLFADAAPPAVPGSAMSAEPTRRDRAVVALREIEFDRATGKLSDADYSTLKADYTARALAAMRAEESALAPGATADDAAEAAVRRARARRASCESCGPRPEADAIYCSACGRYLPGACTSCGATVAERGARFCAACGHSLAA